MTPVVLLRESTLSLLYVHVIASHVFRLLTPLWQKPWLPRPGCSAILLGTIIITTHHLASVQQHLGNISRLPHLSGFSSPPRPSLALPTHFARPSTHPSPALCSGLSAGRCDICHSDEGRGTNPYPISDLSPSSHSLVSLTHSLPVSLPMKFRD